MLEYAMQRIFGKVYAAKVMMIDAHTLIQALGDPTRLRALVLLREEGVLCVCELTAALNVSQPKMSRHLATMRALDVVEDRRVANRVFYRIHPELPGWARAVIDHLASGLTTMPDFAIVQRRLHEFTNRPRQRADFDGANADLDREEIRRAV
jgi:ArsR family transcriptional regulator, arsenate/arsenite/antimonite-responsive transcriptional repressor